MVLCMSQLQLGLMAQSCLAPGSSTLLSNLFSLVNFDHAKMPNESWLHRYGYGACFELYKVKLSIAFRDMPFPEAVRLCMDRLNILLVAVEVQQNEDHFQVLINPSADFIIDDRTMKALVISKDDVEAKRVSTYYPESYGKPSRDKHLLKTYSYNLSSTSFQASARTADSFDRTTKSHSLDSLDHTQALAPVDEAQETKRNEYDSTGTFHWCRARSISEATLTCKEAADRNFSGHVIVCLTSNQRCSSVGICNLTMPLRASSIESSDIKDVVIVGDLSIVEQEWTNLQNLPKIFIVAGSPLNRAFLRAVNIRRCASCLILCATSSASLDSALVDKETILCALNIKTMSRNAENGAGTLRNGMIGDNVPLLTDIKHESNVQYLDEGNQTFFPEIFMSLPFATGRMFHISTLDSLMLATFFSPTSLTFLQTLLTGGAAGCVERILSEGVGLLPGGEGSAPVTGGCALRLLPADRAPLDSDIPGSVTFWALFSAALTQHGILCLGLARLLDLKRSGGNAKRFVFTFPPKPELVLPSDMVYCLVPQRSRARGGASK